MHDTFHLAPDNFPSCPAEVLGLVERCGYSETGMCAIKNDVTFYFSPVIALRDKSVALMYLFYYSDTTL